MKAAESNALVDHNDDRETKLWRALILSDASVILRRTVEPTSVGSVEVG